jgi:ABC-type glycerol-3-phosphate transport system substrate-binding protein
MRPTTRFLPRASHRVFLQLVSLAIASLLVLSSSGCGIITEFRQNLVEGTRLPGSGAAAGPGAAARPTPTVLLSPTSTPIPISTFPIAPDQLKGVSISFWHAWMGATGDAIQKLVDEFNRSNEWGITVTSTALGGFDQTDEAVQAGLKDGQLPDVTTAYLYQALAWQAAGAKLVDLAPYANDAIWGLDGPAQADFYPVFWEHDLQAGKRLGLPALGSAQVLYYNDTWSHELGFDHPPSTPDEFRQQACASAQAALHDPDLKNDHKGGWIISTNYTAVLGWFYAFGATLEAPDGSGYTFNTPQVQDAFTFLRDLLDQGCAWLSESQVPEAEFASRLGLFATGSPAGIPFQEAAFVDAGSQDQWVVIPFPSLTGEPVLPVYSASYQILRSTPKKQLASWVFIKWLTDPAQQAALAQASAEFPVRASALESMGVLPDAHPQWKSALDLLPNARHEPDLASWRLVRWAVYDAATQLYRYYFEIDRVSTLAKLLDDTANDLNSKNK